MADTNQDDGVIESSVGTKENVTEIIPSDLSKSSALRMKAFTYKDDKDQRIYYGAIAEDLIERGLSNLVVEDGDGNLGVDYLSMLSLKAAQHDVSINSLEYNYLKLLKEVEELKKKIDR